MLHDVVETLYALLLLLGCAAIAYTVAARLLGERTEQPEADATRPRTSIRALATFLVGCWILTAAFQLTTFLGVFDRHLLCPAFGICGALALCTGRSGAVRHLLAQDLGHVASLIRRGATHWCGLVALPVAGLLLLRWWRGSVAPPLGWDSLTYHLLKAGRWVQSGSFESEVAPDAWGYYEHFPPGGDVLYAFAMLPGHTDGLIASAGVLIWLGATLVTYALTVTLGARRRTAAMSALALGATPCILNYLTSGYTDTIGFVYVGAACVFAIRVTRVPTLGGWLLTGAALGLALGSKFSAWPIAFVVSLLVLGKSIMRPGPGGRPTPVAVGSGLLAMGIAVPFYIRTWVLTGSPLYPVTISLGSSTILPGNEEMRLLHGGHLLEGRVASPSGIDVLTGLFVGSQPGVSDHLNFGLGMALLLILAFSGCAILTLRRQLRFSHLLPLVVTAVAILSVFSDQATAQRSFWSTQMARFICPALLGILALARIPRGTIAEVARAVAALLGCIYCIPGGYRDADWNAMGSFGVYMASSAAAATLVLLVGRRRGRPRLAAVAGITLLAIGHTVALQPTRQDARYRIYDSAADAKNPKSYDLHTLSSAINASLFWRQFDDGPSYRIAFTAGFDGMGHNWYRYGLLGSRLQNTVHYVPISTDGSVSDYRLGKRAFDAADKQAWMTRLRARRIEFVVAMPPPTPELQWMSESPELFQPLHRFAYRVLPERR